MSVTRYAGDRFVGLSTDTKPNNVADGAIFYTTDTLKVYLKVSGAWVEETSPSNHASLSNLDYDNSGHSGFQRKMTWEDDYKSYVVEKE